MSWKARNSQDWGATKMRCEWRHWVNNQKAAGRSYSLITFWLKKPTVQHTWGNPKGHGLKQKEKQHPLLTHCIIWSQSFATFLSIPINQKIYSFKYWHLKGTHHSPGLWTHLGCFMRLADQFSMVSYQTLSVISWRRNDMHANTGSPGQKQFTGLHFPIVCIPISSPFKMVQKKMWHVPSATHELSPQLKLLTGMLPPTHPLPKKLLDLSHA